MKLLKRIELLFLARLKVLVARMSLLRVHSICGTGDRRSPTGWRLLMHLLTALELGALASLGTFGKRTVTFNNTAFRNIRTNQLGLGRIAGDTATTPNRFYYWQVCRDLAKSAFSNIAR